MPGTQLKYNGVEINDCYSVMFTQVLEYDPSNTDLVFHKFTIKVSGTVHSDVYSRSYHGVNAPGLAAGESTPAHDVLVAIQKRLAHPRGDLEYSVTGPSGRFVVLKAVASPQSPFQDVNNGPKPLKVEVTRVVGGRAFSITFEIEVALVYCSGQVETPLGSQGAMASARVLNNRWSLSEERDGDFYSTRTIEGLLRVSHITAIPQMFRYLCVPPLARGYRRDSMHFIDSPDGLTLKYQIVDKQMYAAPPYPATNWEATYTEMTNNGIDAYGEMSVRLKGSPGTPKSALLATAINVVYERLGNLIRTYEQTGQGPRIYSRLMNAAVVEHLHENIVQVMARVKHLPNENLSNAPQQSNSNSPVPPENTEGFWLTTLLSQIGAPLSFQGYDKDRWPVPDPFGTNSPAGLFLKYLQSPCVDVHGIPQINQPTPEGGNGQNPGGDNSDPEEETHVFYGQSTTTQVDDSTGQNSPHFTSGFPYTYATVEITYHNRDGVMQLPVARWGGSSVPASPQPSCVIIPIHGPLCQREIFVSAERLGDWPSLPEPVVTAMDPNGIPMTRIENKLHFEAPQLTADGKTRLYRGQAKLLYAMARAPLSTEWFATGATQIDEAAPLDNIFDGSTHLTHEITGDQESGTDGAN